jgi:surface protein
MSLVDVQNKLVVLNQKIGTYKTTLQGGDPTAISAAKEDAQQAGYDLAKQMGTTKANNPNIPEADFFSNPGVQTDLVRLDVRNIMTTGQHLGDAMKLLMDTEGTTPGATNVILSFAVGSDITIDWGDGSSIQSYTGAASHNYVSPGQYTVEVRGTVSNFTTPLVESRKQLKDVLQWGAVEFAGMMRMFARRTGFTISATDGPIFLPGARMDSTFEFTTDFNSPIGHWDVSNVIMLYATFHGAGAFNQPLGDWDVGNVTNMTFVFRNTLNFNQPLNNWNVSSVTTLSGAFERSESFNQALNLWDTSSVTSMYGMIYKALAFNQDISMWNVANVTDTGFFSGGEGAVFNNNFRPNF